MKDQIVYKRIEGKTFHHPEKAGEVIVLNETSCVLRCPCAQRTCYLKYHTISFDAEGRLTVQESLGTPAHTDRRQNWCHFWIKNGIPEMCADIDKAHCHG